MTDVLVIGDAIVDAVFDGMDRYPDPGEEVVAPRFDLRPGGSAGYASMGLAALGVDVGVRTVVGSDPLSEFWLASLADRGVDVSAVGRVPGESVSVAAAFLFESDRSFVTYRGATAGDRTPVPPGEAATTLGVDALLVTGFSQAPYLWSETLRSFVRAVGEAGVSVFLDTNWSEGDWQGAVADLLPAVDYLLVNDVEAKRLATAETVPGAGEVLEKRGAGACVITTGADGCTLVTASGVERVGADPVDAVDLCGAGDFFDAGLIAALCDGSTLREAARTANRCAGAAIERFELAEKLSAISRLAR